jgi:hypothetical protein
MAYDPFLNVGGLIDHHRGNILKYNGEGISVNFG